MIFSHTVLMFIQGKGKDDFISGKATCPESTDLKFKVWNFEKYMIMSWLINSMTNKSVQLFSYSILQGRHGMWRMTLILPKTTHQRYSALKAPFKISDRETPMSRLTSLPLLDIGSNLTSLKSTCRNAQTIKSVVGQ